jgi:hypothetical protein
MSHNWSCHMGAWSHMFLSSKLRLHGRADKLRRYHPIQKLRSFKLGRNYKKTRKEIAHIMRREFSSCTQYIREQSKRGHQNRTLQCCYEINLQKLHTYFNINLKAEWKTEMNFRWKSVQLLLPLRSYGTLLLFKFYFNTVFYLEYQSSRPESYIYTLNG